jgi:enamine deaminase RidA (YjgF/YER057c/UK114 family)
MEGNMSAEDRLRELGIELPPPFEPVGSYVAARVSRGMLYVSGQGPAGPDGFVTGKIGNALTVSQGVDAARLAGLNLLAVMRAELGSLDRVTAIVKLLGMVNCAPTFTDTPTIINGCSDLLVDVFGEAGRHARSAVGMAQLPFEIAVEVELIAEID